MTKVCKQCGRELPIERFEQKGNWRRNVCTKCHNAKRQSRSQGKSRGVTHQPGYEALLGAILDRAVLDYKAGKEIPIEGSHRCDRDKPDAWTSKETGEFIPWEPESKCWRGLTCGPQEVVESLDEMMTYFRATDTYLSPEEMRDTFLRVRLGAVLERVC